MLVPLEGGNLNPVIEVSLRKGPNRVGVSLTSPHDGTDPISETLYFLLL
jgi:hypothetical protein